MMAISLRIAERMHQAEKLKLYAQLTQATQEEINNRCRYDTAGCAESAGRTPGQTPS